MPVGRHDSGPLWVDGSIALRVRDKRRRAWRMVRVRRPYAVLGRHPGADVVIARPDVAEHHVFLFLDHRGLFGVDLRTDRGTRFAGTEADASWLGSGDPIELGDHVVEVIGLRVDGSTLSEPLCNDDPLGIIDPDSSDSSTDLTLRLLDGSAANWAIGSSLVFLGRGPACAVRLGDDQVGATHAALLRHGGSAYLIHFPGASSRVNAVAAPAAFRLADADILAIGRDSLLIQSHSVSLAADFSGGVTVHDARPIDPAAGPIDYPALIGRLQAETAALVAVLLRRIEALDEEMANLRDRLDAQDRGESRPATPPVEKLRWDLIPPAGPGSNSALESSSWLVDRLRELEAERQTTWTSLVGRVGARDRSV